MRQLWNFILIYHTTGHILIYTRNLFDCIYCPFNGRHISEETFTINDFINPILQKKTNMISITIHYKYAIITTFTLLTYTYIQVKLTLQTIKFNRDTAEPWTLNYIQSNLRRGTTQGKPQKWLFFAGGCSSQVQLWDGLYMFMGH